MARSTERRERAHDSPSFDRRFGAVWTPAQALKNWAIRTGIHASLCVADLTPRSVLEVLGHVAGRAARAGSGGARRLARERAAASLRDVAPSDVADAAFVNAGRSLALSLLLRRADVRAADHVVLSEASRAVLSRALSSGRGALVVSAHLGPFEMIPARLVEAGFAPAIVVRESYDPDLDAVVDRHRRLRGIEVIHRGRPGSGVRIVRALKSGRPVGVLPDLGGRGLAALALPFLGCTVAFPVGASLLALKTGCPLVLGTLARTASRGPRFELVIDEIATNGTLAQLTRRVADALARAILRSPEDWLWMAAPHLSIADDSDKSLSSRVIRPVEPGRA